MVAVARAFFFLLALGLAAPSTRAASSVGKRARSESRRPARKPTFRQATARYRRQALGRSTRRPLVVNGSRYRVLGRLGAGSSPVYLATSPTGRRVAVKVVSAGGEDPGWPNSIHYEVAVTRFYTERGLDVPQVVDYEFFQRGDRVTGGILVKEYREGITGEELWDAPFITEKDRYRLEGERRAEVDRVKQIHKGFATWLRRNQIRLPPFARRDGLIARGDVGIFGESNWLYDTSRRTWIVIDP